VREKRLALKDGIEEDISMASFFKPALCVKILVRMVLLSAATVGLAQSSTGEFKGDIPFRFVVGNQTLPAGRYTLTPLGETIVRIQGAGNIRVLVQTHSTQRKEPASVTRMVFRRRGDACVLSELWIAGNRIGRQLFMPAGERETTTQEPREIAIVLPAK
jgi:hypothetical protein